MNALKKKLSDFWKVLIGENVSNKEQVKKELITEVEARLIIIDRDEIGP